MQHMGFAKIKAILLYVEMSWFCFVIVDSLRHSPKPAQKTLQNSIGNIQRLQDRIYWMNLPSSFKNNTQK